MSALFSSSTSTPSTCSNTIAVSNIPHTSSYWDRAGGLLENWYIACTSKQLKTNQVLAVQLFGRGLAVFRQADGTATAMVDQCVHRSARLSAGQVKDGCLTCPYHGWRYNGHGQVVHIPSVDGTEAPDTPHTFKQRSFPTIEQDGVVWVYLGQQDPAAQPVYKMPFYDRSDFVSYYMIGIYDGNLGDIAQINMDVSHTVFVHGKLFRTTAGRMLHSTIEVKPREVEVTYHNCNEGLGPIPWLTNPKRRALVHTDRYIAPNITQVDYHWGEESGFVFVSVISPIDEYRSTLYTCISYKMPLPHRVLNLMRPLVHLYTKAVNTQDIQVMKEQRRGRELAPVAQLHSVRADMAHVAIDKILLAIQQQQATPKGILGTREMNFSI